ncbi:MAG TPA: hypothetical protein VD651_04160 [Nitrosarchaeum sp.]|nr:hypothetical protein [Nitrosarchaeum sp.]
MATPFEDIYDSFLAKVTDYSFVSFTEIELEEEFEKYLRFACTKFSSAGNRLLKNHNTKEFNFDLTDLEIEIISLLMIVEYLNPKIVATENMKQYLATKDYKIYSQANHLSKMIELKNNYRIEANQLMSQYSYRDGIGGLR